MVISAIVLLFLIRYEAASDPSEPEPSSIDDTKDNFSRNFGFLTITNSNSNNNATIQCPSGDSLYAYATLQNAGPISIEYLVRNNILFDGSELNISMKGCQFMCFPSNLKFKSFSTERTKANLSCANESRAFNGNRLIYNLNYNCRTRAYSNGYTTITLGNVKCLNKCYEWELCNIRSRNTFVFCLRNGSGIEFTEVRYNNIISLCSNNSCDYSEDQRTMFIRTNVQTSGVFYKILGEKFYLKDDQEKTFVCKDHHVEIKDDSNNRQIIGISDSENEFCTLTINGNDYYLLKDEKVSYGDIEGKCEENDFFVVSYSASNLLEIMLASKNVQCIKPGKSLNLVIENQSNLIINKIECSSQICNFSSLTSWGPPVYLSKRSYTSKPCFEKEKLIKLACDSSGISSLEIGKSDLSNLLINAQNDYTALCLGGPRSLSQCLITFELWQLLLKVAKLNEHNDLLPFTIHERIPNGQSFVRPENDADLIKIPLTDGGATFLKFAALTCTQQVIRLNGTAIDDRIEVVSDYFYCAIANLKLGLESKELSLNDWVPNGKEIGLECKATKKAVMAKCENGEWVIEQMELCNLKESEFDIHNVFPITIGVVFLVVSFLTTLIYFIKRE